MAKNKLSKRALADPTRLAPLDGDGTIQVVIETPKGSRNKYAFDPEQKVFALRKVLPAGMAFPYDFGFIPSTKAEDGDPVDVEEFFVNYHEHLGKKYKVLDVKGPNEAERRIRDGMKAVPR